MADSQSKTSPKRIVYLTLVIITWAIAIGLPLFANSSLNPENLPYFNDATTNSTLAVIGFSWKVLEVIFLIIAIIITLAFIKSNPHTKKGIS